VQADRAQSAGMLLRQVCANQAEELKAYKGAFPTLMKDMSDLREKYYKQEKELQAEVNLKLSLEAEGSELRNRVDCLTNDIKQVTRHRRICFFMFHNSLAMLKLCFLIVIF